MAGQPDFKPQMEQKHPEQWQDDLNSSRMGGQNIGGESEAEEREARTAYDVKQVHRALAGFTDDELKQIPILEPGTRLRQGATYLDLEQGSFTADGVMFAAASQKLVPKDRVHYEFWNRLIGEEKR
jgi:hypothetical protein